MKWSLPTRERSCPSRIGTPLLTWKWLWFQCEGKAYNDKSDIWAMGCILYEMACLQKTFEGTNLPALVNKIMKVRCVLVLCKIYKEQPWFYFSLFYYKMKNRVALKYSIFRHLYFKLKYINLMSIYLFTLCTLLKWNECTERVCLTGN